MAAKFDLKQNSLYERAVAIQSELKRSDFRLTEIILFIKEWDGVTEEIKEKVAKRR